ncbi:sulfatase-like hydrolase/transferase, partial [Clostridium sp. HCP1S3_A12]|uniref:sulfatase-like hydrolase/transferase n=3 Tax=Clostridium TaxID=1485 RepID=UPI003F8BB43D
IINIINLKKQIENIVYCIKEDFCKKNKEYNTKFIFICDSLRYKDVFKLGKMDKLKKRAERGIIIKNAFTHVPYTTGSLLTLFTGKKYLDDGIYNISTLPDNIEIFKEVDRLNYDFKYLGCRTRLFSNKYSINNTNTNMSQIMWLGLCNALKSQKNTLYCLHFMESHSPYFSGKNRKKLVEIAPYWLTNVDDAKIEEEQNIDSLKYMDEQIDFFMNLIGDESQVILFSDHGSIIQNDKITNQDNFYCDDYIRIPYVILNSPLNYLYNNFFSHLDTKNLIINFIRNKNLFDGIDTRKYIEVNRDFTYNDHFLNVTKQNGKLDLGRAFKCFRNQNYKLIKFYDGTKKYYNVPEEKELEGSSIEKFKEIESKFNLNFPKWDSEKYKIAKKFYNIGE